MTKRTCRGVKTRKFYSFYNGEKPKLTYYLKGANKMADTIQTQVPQENPNPDPVKGEPKKERKLAQVWSKTKSGATKVWAKVKKPVTVVLAIGAAVVGAAVVGDAIERKQTSAELPEGSDPDLPENIDEAETSEEVAGE